jgi:hypothetical protein
MHMGAVVEVVEYVFARVAESAGQLGYLPSSRNLGRRQAQC